MKVRTRVWIFFCASAVIFGCGTRMLPVRESKELNQIFRVDDFDLSSNELAQFKEIILRLNPSHMSVGNGTVRIFFPDRSIYYDLTVGRENQVVISSPKRFQRNHYLHFFGFTTPTPTATPTIKKQKPKSITPLTGRKVTPASHVAGPTPTPSPTPKPVVWTKDRIAMEILKGNSPRDDKGNVVHTATGEETLAEVVEWYTKDLNNLGRISSENQIEATEVPLVKGVKIVIPADLVKNPKRFQKR